jgi:hypothetical protein
MRLYKSTKKPSIKQAMFSSTKPFRRGNFNKPKPKPVDNTERVRVSGGWIGRTKRGGDSISFTFSPETDAPYALERALVMLTQGKKVAVRVYSNDFKDEDDPSSPDMVMYFKLDPEEAQDSDESNEEVSAAEITDGGAQ